MKKIRTFLSLNINNTLREKVAQYQDEIKKILTDFNVKWENPEKFHVTLRFLGDLEESKVNEIIEKLGSVTTGFDKISLNSDVVNFFPNMKKPNVIFYGLKDEENKCDILINELDKVLQAFEITPDKKFIPHMTLGRFKGKTRNSVEEISFPSIDNADFEFDRFYLMKSIFDHTGSQHFVIKDFLFK